MKILSIDTASQVCGVSILEDSHLIYQLDHETNQSHSVELMPMIEQAFEKTDLKLTDIDLLVCDKGPRLFYWYSNWHCHYESLSRQFRNFCCWC